MAKVKITGHASGTGVITVTAPNTSTDRTITLPDSTDTLIGSATTDALTTRVNGAGGRKNMVINGAMNVAQRGASQAGYTAGGYYTCDRWKHDKDGSTGTYTMTQEADAPTGFKNSLKLNCTTAGSGGDYDAIHNKIEAQDLSHLEWGTASAKPITLSFWVKVSQTGTMQFNLLHYADAGTRQISYLYTIDAANTWEKKTVTFAGDTVRANDDDNTQGFILEWFLNSYGGRTGSSVLTSWGSYTNAARFEGATIQIGDSTSDTWQIAGVQLEVGSVATDFEHRSYGEELALCQRYYHTAAYRLASHTQTTAVLFNLDFPSTMRAIPSLSIFGSGNKSASTIYYEYEPWQSVGTATSSVVSSGNMDIYGGAIRVTSTYSNSPSVGKPVAIFLANRASANASYLILDSEL